VQRPHQGTWRHVEREACPEHRGDFAERQAEVFCSG
jgi:hypothetical protein